MRETLISIENLSDSKELLLMKPNRLIIVFTCTIALFLAAAGVEGACRALEKLALNGKIKIISFDTTPIICEMVRKGVINATIDQEPFKQGVKPLNILMDYLGMDVVPDREFYYTKAEIKIAENL